MQLFKIIQRFSEYKAQQSNTILLAITILNIFQSIRHSKNSTMKSHQWQSVNNRTNEECDDEGFIPSNKNTHSASINHSQQSQHFWTDGKVKVLLAFSAALILAYFCACFLFSPQFSPCSDFNKGPDTKSTVDYNMSDSFNLWNMSPKDKRALLLQYKSLPPQKKHKKQEKYLQINYDNEAFLEHSKIFEKDSEVVNWSQIELTEEEKNKIGEDFEANKAARRKKVKNVINNMKQHHKNKTGLIQPNKQITYEQLLQSLEYQQLTGQNFKQDPAFKKLYLRERLYYEKKYHVNSYSNEIHACVICPTFKNNINFRYGWHIESIMQQQYSNFRVIIIDDASPDHTGDAIAKYLKWRNFPKDKIVLIKNKVHKTAMENFYYTVNKYCDFNQIFYVVDGDDELSGTQVFSMFNALYQQKKLYTLYSNYFAEENSNPLAPVSVGISQNYTQSTIKTNSYRDVPHVFSHQRTMMTDMFLFTQAESFKDAQGKFYWMIPDDAQYFPAMEMSCGRIHYVPQLKYWYTASTGNNQNLNPQEEILKVFRHIRESQKRYHCINNVFERIYQSLRSERMSI